MTRPANFTGFAGVVSGALASALTATDWTAFTNRLVAFALYKSEGMEIRIFDTVSAGSDITASTFNRRVNALNILASYITQPIPSAKSSGQELYASYITALKNALNSIA